MARIDPTKLNLEEKVVQINRVAKVVKGGRRFSFSAVVVVGDGNGRRRRRARQGQRGARGDPQGRRGRQEAPHPRARWSAPRSRTMVQRDFGAATRPAAGRPRPAPASSPAAPCAPSWRPPGIRDILSKSMGSNNPVNVVRATIEALRSLRSADDIAASRGTTAEKLLGKRGAEALAGRTSTSSARRRRSREAAVAGKRKRRAADRSCASPGSSRRSVIRRARVARSGPSACIGSTRPSRSPTPR